MTPRLLAATLAALVGACGDSGDGARDPGDTRSDDAADTAGVDGSDAEEDLADGGADAESGDADPDGDADADPDADAADGEVPDGSGPSAPWTVSSAPIALTVTPAELRMEVSHGGEARVAFEADAFQLGVVRRLDATRSYGPTGLFAESGATVRPQLEHWATVTAIRPAEGGAVLEFDDGRSARLAIAAESGRLAFRLAVLADALEGEVAFLRVRAAVSESERFYGLGELFDQVEHRGTVRAMQLEGDVMEGANNEAHVPVPFVTGTSGWGLFFATYRPGVFDVAKADPTRLDVVFGMAEDAVEGLAFHVFSADAPLDVTRHYYEVTGYPARPARWAFGPWIWRDENDDEAQFRNDAQTIRDLDLATTALWIDRPYASAVGAFDWKESQWLDARAMIADVRALGFRVALWSVPYLHEGEASTAALVAEAVRSGYYPPRTALNLNNWGRPIDLTNPAAVSWWQALVQRYIDDGIEGFKLDYGEDIILAPLGGRFFWEFSDGSDDRTMHAAYQLAYHRTYAELLPEDGGFLLCRGGTWGDQVNVSVVWPGDLNADFTRHRERVTEGGGSYVSVGGLPAALIGGLSLGPSGFPLYGSDTGGYRHAPPDKETFTRWFQITALSPVMQVGTNTNDVPWEPTAGNGFDAEMLDWYREYARLHLRLWPYVWTYLDDLYEDGRPIQRAFGLAYPEYGRHPSDVFLLGDHLLVAPVVERGARARAVFFPDGQWVDWWTGETTFGPQEVEVAAPLDVLPLYVRAGATIPMLRDTIDAMAPVEDPDAVDSYATTPGVLTVLTTQGPPSGFELFDGTRVGQATVLSATTLSYTEGAEFDLGVRFELIGVGEPVGVTANGEPMARVDGVESWTAASEGWTWTSARNGTLFVQSTADSVTVAVDFGLD